MVGGSSISWRAAVLCTPVIAVPSGSCDSERDAAAALLLTLPACYLLALPVVAVLVWLWRRRPQSLEFEWRWLLSYLTVIGPMAVFPALVPLGEPYWLASAFFYQALFLCAWLCVVARVAISLGSRWVMRIGTAFVLAMLAIPPMFVFFENAGSAILWFVVAMFVGPWSWLWGAVLVVLFIEALVRGRPSARGSTTS